MVGRVVDHDETTRENSQTRLDLQCCEFCVCVFFLLFLFIYSKHSRTRKHRIFFFSLIHSFIQDIFFSSSIFPSLTFSVSHLSLTSKYFYFKYFVFSLSLFSSFISGLNQQHNTNNEKHSSSFYYTIFVIACEERNL